MASDQIALPPDVTDVERLLFVLSKRGEIWKKMLLGNPRLNIAVNKQFAEKSSPVKAATRSRWWGFRWCDHARNPSRRTSLLF